MFPGLLRPSVYHDYLCKEIFIDKRREMTRVSDISHCYHMRLVLLSSQSVASFSVLHIFVDSIAAVFRTSNRSLMAAWIPPCVLDILPRC